MLLQSCALGVTRSWDEGFLGARASRPHQARHSLGYLPHLNQPGTAPWLSFGLAAAVPADRVAACSIALKLSDGQRDKMRAGRPRSQGNHSPLEGESQKPSRQAKADAVGGVRRSTSQKAHVHPLGISRLPASRAPALPCGLLEEPFAKFGVGHEMGAECSCKITPSKGICTWLAMGFPLGARASRPHTCQGAAPASVGG